MRKIFLYLYPIKEYTSMFLFHDDNLYDEWNVKRPLPILNECIQKRYRDKDYQVVFALYPDKKIFGIDFKEEDKVVYTDILFSENSAYDENGNIKEKFIPKYPNEQLLIKQLGDIDELVVGGYHYSDCVKRVAKIGMALGIKTIVDLDLTDLFFNLYKDEDYFDIDKYDPERFKKNFYKNSFKYGDACATNLFNENYSNPVYGFNSEISIKKL